MDKLKDHEQPGNPQVQITDVINNIEYNALNTTPLIAWGRLPVQFVFIAIAYWHTKL